MQTSGKYEITSKRTLKSHVIYYTLLHILICKLSLTSERVYTVIRNTTIYPVTINDINMINNTRTHIIMIYVSIIM